MAGRADRLPRPFRTLAELRNRVRAGELAFLRPRAFARHAYAYALDRVGRSAYRLLTDEELLATRVHDTAFVFGSGRSLLEICEEEWEHIAHAGTISFREFPRQRWIRADYHLTSEIDFIDGYAARLRENPLYDQTVFVVQGGFRAEAGNTLVGRHLLKPGSRVYRFRRRSRGVSAQPSRRLADGLVHGYSSLFDAVNLAYLLGFRQIVLAGVDLYNKEYFWLPAGEARTYEKGPIRASDPFAGARAIVEMMGGWHDILAAEGVELLVQNPRSLLAERLPVFTSYASLACGDDS
jgi:hypothetical protein